MTFKLYQRGPDGFPVGSDALLRDSYGPIPDADRFLYRYDYRPAIVHGWQWSTTFGKWSALVTFADGWHGFTYAEPARPMTPAERNALNADMRVK